MTPPNKFIALLIFAMVIFSGYSVGQTSTPSNTVNEVKITSNSFSVDSKSGAVHHTGNVVMRYGAFLIEAESVSEYKKNDLFEKAVAVGSPATFQQLAGAGKELVVASGAEIVFINNPTEQSIQIKGDAFLQQAGISATCSQLNILLNKGVVENIDGSGGESQCQIISNNSAPNEAASTEPTATLQEP